MVPSGKSASAYLPDHLGRDGGAVPARPGLRA